MFYLQLIPCFEEPGVEKSGAEFFEREPGHNLRAQYPKNLAPWLHMEWHGCPNGVCRKCLAMYKPDPADDPNDAYAVIPTPAELRGPPTDWWTVT